MKTLLAISPHLDDAAFSAGATLWQASQQGWRVIVATMFTGNVRRPTGFALACQLDKGLSPDIDYMALRRDEDLQACALLAAEPMHLPLLEAPHRGYDDAAALFGEVGATDEARSAVLAAVTSLVATIRPTCLLAPMGLGRHVDHLIVRNAVMAASPEAAIFLWEDWPYADRHEAPTRAKASFIEADPSARSVKALACAAYATQLGFQFGGADRLHARLASQTGEWLHPCDRNDKPSAFD